MFNWISLSITLESIECSLRDAQGVGGGEQGSQAPFRSLPSVQRAMSAVTASNGYVIGGFFKTKVLHEIKLVTNPCSENQGTQALWQIEQNIHLYFPGSAVKMYRLIIVLPWLGADGTLLKEFEKNKIGNIPLRAVPVEEWVATWLISSQNPVRFFIYFQFSRKNPALLNSNS